MQKCEVCTMQTNHVPISREIHLGNLKRKTNLQNPKNSPNLTINNQSSKKKNVLNTVSGKRIRFNNY